MFRNDINFRKVKGKACTNKVNDLDEFIASAMRGYSIAYSVKF